MQLGKNHIHHADERAAGQIITRRRWGQPLLVLAAMLVLSLAAYSGPQQVQRDPAWQTNAQGTNGVPDPNELSQMRDRQAAYKNIEAANADRKKQITDDSEKLLKLATDLKDEVDKTDKDTLSISVIKKAEEIEKLAHSVREKMKLTVGAS
jgi:hypothetical protein